MSVLSPQSDKKQRMEVGLELQDRPRPLCWPHVNGTAHQPSAGTTQHNVPLGTVHHNLTTEAQSNVSPPEVEVAHLSLPPTGPVYHNSPLVTSAHHNLPPTVSSHLNAPSVTTVHHSLRASASNQSNSSSVATTQNLLTPKSAAHQNVQSIGTTYQNLPPVSTAHHNLPPIAAITSCRPSSSPALKTPIPSAAPRERNEDQAFTPPQTLSQSSSPSPKSSSDGLKLSYSSSVPSHWDQKEEHVFTQPNPPRLVQPAARAPTPFPEHPPVDTRVFQSSSFPPLRLEPRTLTSVQPLRSSDDVSPTPAPVPFSIPSKSAFAAVPRVALDKISPSDGSLRAAEHPVSPQTPSSPYTGSWRQTAHSPADAVVGPETNPLESALSPSPSLTQAERCSQPPPGGTIPPAELSVFPVATEKSDPISLRTTTDISSDELPNSVASDVNRHRVFSGTHSFSEPREDDQNCASGVESGGILANPSVFCTKTPHSTTSVTSISSQPPDNVTSNDNPSNDTNINEEIKTTKSIHNDIRIPPVDQYATPTSQCNSSQREQTTVTSSTECSYNAFSGKSLTSQASHHVPSSSSDGLRNFSNQSHRYFASPASTNDMRSLSSPCRNNPTLSTVSTPTSFVTVSRSYPATNTVQSTLNASNVPYSTSQSAIADNMRSFPNSYDRKLLQDSVSNVNRRPSPSARSQQNNAPGDLSHSFSPHNARYSSHIPAGSTDNLPRHCHPYTSSRNQPMASDQKEIHQLTSSDARRYTPQIDDRLNAPNLIVSSNPTSFHGKKETSGISLPQNAVKPPYLTSLATTPLNREGNPLPTTVAHSIGHYPPQQDRSVIYPQSDNTRAYATHCGKSAGNSNTMPTQALHPTYNPQALTNSSEPPSVDRRPGHSLHTPARPPDKSQYDRYPSFSPKEVPRYDRLPGFSSQIGRSETHRYDRAHCIPIHGTTGPPDALRNDRAPRYSPQVTSGRSDTPRSEQSAGPSPHSTAGYTDALRNDQVSGFSAASHPDTHRSDRVPGFSPRGTSSRTDHALGPSPHNMTSYPDTLGPSLHNMTTYPDTHRNDRVTGFSPRGVPGHPGLSRADPLHSDRSPDFSPHVTVGSSDTLGNDRVPGFNSEGDRGHQKDSQNVRYRNYSAHPTEISRSDRPSPSSSSLSQPSSGPPASSRTFTPRADIAYPSHPVVSSSEPPRVFQRRGERGISNHPPEILGSSSRNTTPPGMRPGNYPYNSAAPQTVLQTDKSMRYRGPSTQNYPTSTSVTLSAAPQKIHEHSSFPTQNVSKSSLQPYARSTHPGTPAASHPQAPPPTQSYPQGSRLPEGPPYNRADPSSHAWNNCGSGVRALEAINPFMSKTPSHRSVESERQTHHSHSLAQLHNIPSSYPQTQHSLAPSPSAATRDRSQQQTPTNAMPRVNPPAIVSVSGNRSSHFSSHSTQGSSPYYGGARAHPSDNSKMATSNTYGVQRQACTTVSSSYTPSLPRVNFPSPAVASFSSSTIVAPNSAYVTPRGGSSTMSVSSHQSQSLQSTVLDTSRLLPHQLSPSPSAARHQTGQAYSYLSQQGLPQFSPSHNQLGKQQNPEVSAYRHNASQYVPTRGYPMETDTCRNPFELPAPASNPRTQMLPISTGVIKSQPTPPSISFCHVNEAKGNVLSGVSTRSPFAGFPENSAQPLKDGGKQGENIHLTTRYFAPSGRTEQRSASGSDERQKPITLSARFPPVPQSNFDLQRQIYDRMTGLQQAPPRLVEKSMAESKASSTCKEAPRHKRESPLDLSVKTVRQSADSTRDDVDLYLTKHFSHDSRLAGAPKIDFNPNFAGPLVQPETRNLVTLPPVQSIRKFQPPLPAEPNISNRKRPVTEHEAVVAPKIPKVDAWKLAMDEQIEERLKAARQSRYPTAPLTPLHPPAQSVTPTNPDVLQPPARPLSDQHTHDPGRTGARGWSAGVFQPPTSGANPEHLVQQISQGVMADTRLLQDRNVVDILRSSLEEKEARLQALQEAARRRQPLPSFEALGVERMCVPPSYPHGQSRGAEPVTIGVEATRNYMRGPPGPGRGPTPEADLDGLAAFLAARIRTKAEMKQMGPSADHVRPPDSQGCHISALGTSPPKLMREMRLPQGCQGQPPRRALLSPSSDNGPPVVPRDPAGLRSSSETSVFDFRESDSESEMPVLERQTLDGMRRPRKTLPRPIPLASADPQPGPSHKDELPPESDPAWDNACDMFVEQLQTRPIKRSVRRKKPNPKFFANELETPQFLKVKTENSEIKTEPDSQEDKEASKDVTSTIPKSCQVIKHETEKVDGSDDEMPPLPIVVKEESSSGEEELAGVAFIKEGRVKLLTRKQRVVASDSEWGSSAVETTSLDESESNGTDSEEESEDSTAKKLSLRVPIDEDSDSEEEVIPRQRKGRCTRSRPVSPSEGDSDGSFVRTKPSRSRKVVASDSDASNEKPRGRRTRARPLSESGEESETKRKGPRTRARGDSESGEESDVQGKGGRVRTRQQGRTVHPPARMKLRSKKRGAAKVATGAKLRDGWEEDLIKFKQQLRMPDRLINVSKPKKRQGRPSSLPDLDDDGSKESSTAKSGKKSKKEKKGQHEKRGGSMKSSRRTKDKRKTAKEKDCSENKSKDRSSSAPPTSHRRLGMVTRGKGKLLPKRSGLRASVGMRRSNKAVQNSKRHLNKGKKRLKLRRKFRSGLDYLRRKKKQVQRKEGLAVVTVTETKRREKSDVADISAEVKTWVVNKSAGETILHRAARLGYADVVAYCLESLRFAPSPRDHAGYTPLHEACSRGHVAVANYLLQYGANVSESARGGVRPLHQAAENNHIELVRLLLAYGADPLLATYTGQTALSLTSNDEVQDLIKRHMADVQGEDAPKWHFNGPATVFDPKWAVNPLADPPSPELSPLEVEIEASNAMLPPLYRLPPEGRSWTPHVGGDSNERWLLLTDLIAYTKAPSREALLARLPNTLHRQMADKEFLECVTPCNILSFPKVGSRNVDLLRYDDAVRKVLDVEVFTIPLSDP